MNNYKFYRRIIKVTANIVSFYIANPTEHRYYRLKKILDRLLEVNDSLTDNEYRRDNYSSLTTAKSILTNVGNLAFICQVEKLVAPAYRNRKVTIECGTYLLSLNPDK